MYPSRSVERRPSWFLIDDCFFSGGLRGEGEKGGGSGDVRASV